MTTHEENGTKAAIDAGLGLAGIEKRISKYEHEEGRIPLVLVPNGMTIGVAEKAIEIADKRAPAPRRITGTARHQELDSFIEHVNRFKTGASAIFANVDKTTLLAVYDYHEKPGAPAWGQHRAEYSCPLSAEWKLWNESNGRVFKQDAFGEFIDANRKDIASPAAVAGGAVPEDVAAAAGMLEMARNLVVRTEGEFQRTVNPTTGEFTLINRQNNTATSTRIYRAFYLQLAVFEGGERYAVEAQVRFSLNGGVPTFAYVLVNPEVTLRDAFNVVRKRTKEETGLPVFAGSPE